MQPPAERRLNTTDIVLGGAFLILIPMITLLCLKNSREGGAAPVGATDPKSRMAMTAEELEEERDHYVRIYRENVDLFRIRIQAESDPDFRSQEVSWTRSTLEHCRKGFTTLVGEARAAPPSANHGARISELEEWIRKVNHDLAATPPASPGGR